jgi:restriction endonuclease Mrr
VFRDLARLPEAAVRVLRGQGGRKPLRAADILAEWSARGVPEARVPAVALAAALAGGDARRKVGAPVISVSGGRWVPAEWVAGEEIAALERKVDAAAVQHASVLRRTILRRLGEMPAAAFQQVVVALLAAMGFRDLRPFDEPAAPADRVAPAGAGDALLLRARMPYGPAEVEVVVLVVRTAPGRFVGDEQIAGLRGRMPRTGACGGVVVTTGRIGDVARRDLTPPNAIPLLAIEHDALADRLLEHRIGIVARCLEVPMVDPDVFGQAGEPDRG